MSTIPPIRREILVDADPAVAFEVFTDGLGDWWPLGEHSVHGAGGTVAFDGGQIVERSADGKTVVWGTVTRWEPPAAVAFTWHPGRAAERVSHVVVTFAAATGPAVPVRQALVRQALVRQALVRQALVRRELRRRWSGWSTRAGKRTTTR